MDNPYKKYINTSEVTTTDGNFKTVIKYGEVNPRHFQWEVSRSIARMYNGST